MLWGRPWKSFAEKRNGSAFYIRNFSGFCFDVPENRKNTDIRICQSVQKKDPESWKTDIGRVTWRKRFLEAAAAGILIGTLILDSRIAETRKNFLWRSQK